jgi:hypothetical protein
MLLASWPRTVRSAEPPLQLACAELGRSVWSSTDIGNHALIMPGLGMGLLQTSTHSIKVDFANNTAIIDRFDGGNTNNPALGEVRALIGPDFISISNVIPPTHGDGVDRLTIGIDRRTRTFIWQEQTLDSANRVGLTSVFVGICDTTKPKF